MLQPPPLPPPPPPPELVVQVPLAQYCELVQAWPQLPQLPSSVWVSTQPAPQMVWLTGQWHWPLMHA